MYRWLAEKLGNVSVKTKLAVGFGLVLLLTLMITFTGWSGLGDVISRGDKLGYISSLNGLPKTCAWHALTTRCAVANKARPPSANC